MTKKTEIIRRLRKNYSYTLPQLQKSFGMHPNTLRGYIKDIDNSLNVVSTNPALIFSETLRDYLRKQVEQRKRKLGEYEFYCMSCKQKHTPFQNKITEININKNLKIHKATCPNCFCIMNKYQSSKRLNEILHLFKIISLEQLHILQNENTPLNIKNKKKVKKGKKDTIINYKQQKLI